MTPIDNFRLEILKHLSNTESFTKSWDVWGDLIQQQCSGSHKAHEIFTLGEKLSEFFRANKVEGRGQSAVSSGGAAWECLVTWYLNIVFWGTNVVATRQNKKFVPQVISDALTVTIANQQTNTESDVLVYSVPTGELPNNPKVDDLNNIIKDNMLNTNLTVVQCKTNWNDNAQIPMLWDLIYNSQSFRIPNVSVGIKGYNPASFKRFSYAFVTVPTVNVEIKPTSLAVLRVKNMTGGNYWGKASQNGVASCVNELFLRNFPDVFAGGITQHIDKKLVSRPEILNRFLNLDFS